MTTFAQAMPGMLRHEGEWDGRYRHVAADGKLLDSHRTWTRCEFPSTGPFAYVQHNHLRWEDGRESRYDFGGSFDGEVLRWDTDRFVGYGWETREGVLMLRLDRRDDPGVHFIEMITLADDGASRARTWQWFRDGVPFKRTLCDEARVA